MYLETQRLILRKPEDYDINDFYEIYSNPNVTLSSGFYPIGTMGEAKKYIELFKELDEYVIVLKSENKVIGVIGYDTENGNTAMLSYLLGEKYWGKGYSTEALKTIISSLKNSNIEYIMGDCFLDNYASEKVMKKCGLQYVRQYNRTYSSLDNKEMVCKLYEMSIHDVK